MGLSEFVSPGWISLGPKGWAALGFDGWYGWYGS